LWRETALRVLPGAYLGTDAADGSNPGAAYVRLALVHNDTVVGQAVDRLLEVLG
jgi:aspartate/methionine/tyrosine aminotransferase